MTDYRTMTIAYRVGKGLYVNLTNRCPCACTFCIRQNGPGVYGSDSLWLEREPTERLDVLLAVARYVRTSFPGLPIRVNTNGLSDLIAGRPTAALFAGLVDVLSVSLNAPTAEEYVKLCRPKFGAAAFDALQKFAVDAKAYVPSVVMSVVGTPDMTPEKIADCQAVCDRIGIPLRVRTYTPS